MHLRLKKISNLQGGIFYTALFLRQLIGKKVIHLPEQKKDRSQKNILKQPNEVV